jgi:hypothetical protein
LRVIVLLLDHFFKSIFLFFLSQISEVVITIFISFVLACELFFLLQLVCIEYVDVRVTSSLKLEFGKIFSVKLILLHLQEHYLVEFVFNLRVPLWFGPLLVVFVLFPQFIFVWNCAVSKVELVLFFWIEIDPNGIIVFILCILVGVRSRRTWFLLHGATWLVSLSFVLGCERLVIVE